MLKGPGLFGGMYEISGYDHPVIVSSADGVGTKLKLAAILNRFEGIGHDIVNHCVNDILTTGAAPLFFLDYIASSKLDTSAVKSIIEGISGACVENGCALIGGETAEMPGLYHGKDLDVVGFITGAVEKDLIITGQSIGPGDAILGIPSSGLHTNGYSLARRVLGESPDELNSYYDELGKTLGQALLEPHRSYYRLLEPVLRQVRGLAHITGGGIPGNVIRILPEGTCARFNVSSWPVHPIFELIRRKGNIDTDEMYKVFNMGIGMVVICRPQDSQFLEKNLEGALTIGTVTYSGDGKRVVLE